MHSMSESIQITAFIFEDHIYLTNLKILKRNIYQRLEHEFIFRTSKVICYTKYEILFHMISLPKYEIN